jgi:hypothetical protein
MSIDPVARVHLRDIEEKLEQLVQTHQRRFDLELNRFEVEQQAVRAQDTANLIAVMRLQHELGQAPDPCAMRTVKDRLGL